MTKFELKKVFCRLSSRIALAVLLAALAVICWSACRVVYVDAEGKEQYGHAAAAALREGQKAWAGTLDEEKLRQAIAENRRIAALPEYHSNVVVEDNKAYHQRQPIEGIRDLLNSSYAVAFRDFNYYRADELTEADAPRFYSNRPALLQEWLEGEATDRFSAPEKTYLLRQYETLTTPFAFDYVKGWSQLFENIHTVVMLTMLVTGFLVSGIFSNEFTWRADAVFFAAERGRDKAVAAKLKAGFLITASVYAVAMLLYTAVTLTYLGGDGRGCPIQLLNWKSFYHLTIGQAYLLILCSGGIGCLFTAFLSMIVSAKTRSAVIAEVIPFTLIFLPILVARSSSQLLQRVLGLFPHQLLQTWYALCAFELYTIGGKIVGAVAVVPVLYAVLTLLLAPLLYQSYRRAQVR